MTRLVGRRPGEGPGAAVAAIVAGAVIAIALAVVVVNAPRPTATSSPSGTAAAVSPPSVSPSATSRTSPTAPAPSGTVGRSPEPASGTYRNPVLDGDFPDPTILKASDGWYYAYATQTETARGMVNLQVARSRDLVKWDLLPDALPRKPGWASGTQDFWAPHVIERRGVFYMYYSAEPDTADGLCLAVATARSARGPFRDVGKPLECGEGFINIDPMAFDDPRTGKRLLYWGSGFAPIKVRELAPDRVSFAPGSSATDLLEPNGANEYENLVEGAWVVLRDDWYYMFYSGDACCGPNAHYAVMVARSRSATGPYEKLADVRGDYDGTILVANEQWAAPGHNAVLTDGAGRDWLVYHAIDPANPSLDPANPDISRRPMLFDPIAYREGWPTIGNGTPSTAVQEAPVP